MNKKLNLAVAGAVLAFGAASAQAGIVIPAGEWTLDVSGNVNTFYSNTTFSGNLETQTIAATYAIGTAVALYSGTASTVGGTSGTLGATVVVKTAVGYATSARATNQALTRSANEVSTGLLPSAIGFGGKTRQNDIDVAFQTTFFVGANTSTAGLGTFGNNNASLNSLNIRQAFLTFGDKSWGQFKLGRDLGVFGSDAILSDMTLLGVGTGAGGAGSSTLGRIGSGYLYADWIGQIQYQSPNFSGFQVTGAIREPLGNSANHELGYEGKATYDLAVNDVTGRIWVGGIHQKIAAGATAASTTLLSQVVGGGTATYTYAYSSGSSAFSKNAEAVEVGAKISVAGAGLVGYYYDGKNIGQPGMFGDSSISLSGLTFNNADSADHDVKGGYVQGTFTIPGAGTKLGASWGKSEIKGTNIAGLTSGPGGVAGSSITYENESWVVGAYHPLTKHLNLVAEYTDAEFTNINYYSGYNGKARTGAIGAILFF
jgi:predicted porin